MTGTPAISVMLFTIGFAAGCVANNPTSVCDEAEAIALECGAASQDIDFGDCSGELREAAAEIVDAGCTGLRSQKGDVLSQLCIGPLRDFFPFCAPAEIRCEPTAADLDPTLCNGSAELCERPFDEVVFATSHNAFSAATMGFLRPNQSTRMYSQLRDGMRGLMVDTRRNGDGELSMCHLDCALGEVSFEEGLAEVAAFLGCHPNEIVTLIIEPHVPGIDHMAGFRATGLDKLAYEHTLGQPWPTLGEMIAMGKRLVVLAEKPGEGTPGWYHHQWDFGFDNEYAVKDPADFACELKRGETSNALFGLNHFVTKLGGDEFLAIEPNKAESLFGHVEQCQSELGRLPNFIAVDFHDIGSVVEVTAELNRR